MRFELLIEGLDLCGLLWCRGCGKIESENRNGGGNVNGNVLIGLKCFR